MANNVLADIRCDLPGKRTLFWVARITCYPGAAGTRGFCESPELAPALSRPPESTKGLLLLPATVAEAALAKEARNTESTAIRATPGSNVHGAVAARISCRRI